MNINTANSPISNVNNTARPSLDKVNNAFTAKQTVPAESANQVTVSDDAKISSHLDSLHKKDRAEITSFMQGLDKNAPNLNAQMSKAPQSVREMAHKLQMNMEEMSAAMPKEGANTPAVKGNNSGSKGIAAYNAIAGQPKSAPVTPINSGVNNVHKALVA